MSGPRHNPLDTPAPEFTVSRLLDTDIVCVRHVNCRGTCRHRSAEESASQTHFVFPFRGVYLRHVGDDQAVADANHVLFFNAGEGYQVSHPASGGDACLSLAVSPPLLRELAPPGLLQRRDVPGFRMQSLRIDPRAQVLVALLRHSLAHGTIEALEAESLALTLVARSLGPRTTHASGATHARRRLVDRAKVLLAGDLTRRWTLAEIAGDLPQCRQLQDERGFLRMAGIAVNLHVWHRPPDEAYLWRNGEEVRRPSVRRTRIGFSLKAVADAAIGVPATTSQHHREGFAGVELFLSVDAGIGGVVDLVFGLSSTFARLSGRGWYEVSYMSHCRARHLCRGRQGVQDGFLKGLREF